MAYYYVYAPFGGNTASKVISTADYRYCDGTAHYATNLCCPLDIGAAVTGQVVKFRGSANIKSIKVIHQDICTQHTAPSGYGFIQNGARVELYCGLDATGTMVGQVYYGHLKSRNSYVANNSVWNYPSGNVTLGKTGAVPPSYEDIWKCYKSVHIHMERSSNGETRNSGFFENCNEPVTTSTWIYRWTGPDICAV